MFAFESFADFMTMSEHGKYVWAAYGISGVVLVGLLLWPARECRRQLRLVKKQSNNHAAAPTR